MSEVIVDRTQQITAIREQVAGDGHFAENAASLIVASVSPVRDLYSNPADAILGLTDALAGYKSKFSANVVNQLVVLREVLGEKRAGVADAAVHAAIYSSVNDRQELKKAREIKGKGMLPLREASMKLRFYTDGKENFIPLGDKIKAITTPR